MKAFQNSIFIIFLMLYAFTVQAQMSDYQIKTAYEKAYEELQSQVEAGRSINTFDSLAIEIDSLRSKYQYHESIINHALYPETLDEQISELKEMNQRVLSKQLMIDNLNEKLRGLNKQLTSYQTEIQNLTLVTDSLRQTIQEQGRHNRTIATDLQHLKSKMEERDRLVLNMVDSLFAGYKDLNKTEIFELKGEYETYDINDGNNPLVFLQSVIQNNTEWVKSSKSTLQTEDLLRMYVIQHRVNEVWNKIGENLIAIYGDSNNQQWRNNIENSLWDWKATTSRNMWESLNQDLEKRNLDLNAFDNNQSFYSAIDSFIKQATNNSQEKVLTNEEYQDFQAFYDFWNQKLKRDWGSLVQEGQVLTFEQISAIDTEMMEWRDASKPKSFFIPILLVVSLLLIIVLVIVLARRPTRTRFLKG